MATVMNESLTQTKAKAYSGPSANVFSTIEWEPGIVFLNFSQGQDTEIMGVFTPDEAEKLYTKLGQAIQQARG